MKGESMKKKDNDRIINDETMYDYFHNLSENLPDFLRVKRKDERGKTTLNKFMKHERHYIRNQKCAVNFA